MSKVNQQDIDKLIELVGGRGNIATVSHCITRLRFVLNDPAIARPKEIEQLRMVKGCFTNAGQFQVVIGTEVGDYYKALLATTGQTSADKEQVKQAAREGGAKVHLASGAIGGFDVLQTVSLMAQAQRLPETAGIETHTGAHGFRNTPVWADHLLTDTEKTTVFTGNAKEAIATFPRRVNVAVATSLATTGPEITDVTMHSVPNWVGDDHRITAEIDGVKAVVDIYSSTSAIAGWSVVALLRNLASPVVFY